MFLEFYSAIVDILFYTSWIVYFCYTMHNLQSVFFLLWAFILAASIFGAFSKIFERRNLSEEYVIEIELKEKI